MVPFNVILTLYGDAGLHRNVFVIDWENYRAETKVKKLGNEMYCFDLHKVGFGDVISSLEVVHKKIGAATGKWMNIGK